MSSPTSPIDLLQYLSLNPQMSPTTEEVRLRLVTIKDILSSFDRHEFPSEFKSDISANLDRPPNSRQQQSEWTIQSDLTGTLLQWAVYDEQAYDFLRRIQPPVLLARCFHEKLSRRFGNIFETYDALTESSTVTQDSLDQVENLATGVYNIALAVQEDHKHRKIGQEQTAKISLDALIGICQRDDDLVPDRATSRRKQKQSESDLSESISLFKMATQIQPTERSGFFLMLEIFNSYPAKVLSTMQSGLQELSTLLEENDAPNVFIARADHLLRRSKVPLVEQSQAEPTSAGTVTSSSTRSSSRAQVAPSITTTAQPVSATGATEVHDVDPEAVPRAGSKRQAAQQGSSKRGRKGPARK